MKRVRYFIFAIILGYTGLWMQINLLLATLGKDKPPLTTVRNETLTNLMAEKTGLKLVSVKIAEADRPFGMMTSVFWSPQMILSRNLYENFNASEMEYVVFHEAGHYKLRHIFKEWLLGLMLLGTGIWILKKLKTNRAALFAAATIGFIFGVIMIQLGKIHELQADQYSLDRMADPRGMITATEKFKSYYGPKYSQNTNPVIQWLFYRANPYDNRIKMAEAEISSREVK